MKSQHHLYAILWIILLEATFVSCTHPVEGTISLASFTENDVGVSIILEKNTLGYVLSATFTPPEGYHLYSKDLPIAGIDGLGRPTLLALTHNSLMKATGELSESVRAEIPEFEPRELLVYPLGPLKLSLPVELPPGPQWIADEVKVTYMACSSSLCKPPVVGKIVPVRVPGADMPDNE